MAIHYIGLSLIWIHFCLRKLTFEINYSLASLKLHMFENLIVVIFKINIFVLKAGANPGFKDKAGRHSLHWAAHHGHVKCLKSLLNSKSAAAQ